MPKTTPPLTGKKDPVATNTLEQLFEFEFALTRSKRNENPYDNLRVALLYLQEAITWIDVHQKFCIAESDNAGALSSPFLNTFYLDSSQRAVRELSPTRCKKCLNVVIGVVNQAKKELFPEEDQKDAS